MHNPLMVGSRVYLRPQEASDAELMARFDHLETENEMTGQFRIPTSPLEFAWQIEQQHSKQPPGFIELAACLRESDEFIGVVGLWNIDWVQRSAETGSHLGPAFRSQAYGTEAKHLLLEYAFDVLHLHQIWSEVNETNERSARALLKQGYCPAGHSKWNRVYQARYQDIHYFDLVREDWIVARDTWRASLVEQQG